MQSFNEAKREIVENFKDFACTIGTTSYMWEGDHNKVGYCAITAHFIDDDWLLQKRIIGFRQNSIST